MPPGLSEEDEPWELSRGLELGEVCQGTLWGSSIQDFLHSPRLLKTNEKFAEHLPASLYHFSGLEPHFWNLAVSPCAGGLSEACPDFPLSELQ